MTERAPVDLVRVPQQEKLYEREAVLGRDTTSVFPSETAKEGFASQDAKDMVGTSKFVTEAQLEEARQQGTDEQGEDTGPPMRTLTEILREAKEKKEEDFQAQWRQMKQGKNRPLDEDELDFLERVRSQQRAKEHLEREQDSVELDAFQLAVRQAAEAKESREDANHGELPETSLLQAHSSQPEPAPRIVKRGPQRPAVIIKKGSIPPPIPVKDHPAKAGPVAASEPHALSMLFQQYSSGSSSGEDAA